MRPPMLARHDFSDGKRIRGTCKCAAALHRSYELTLPVDNASAQVIASAIAATASAAGAILTLSLQLQTL